MKKLTLLSFLIVLAGYSFAQQQTFDLATFTPPKGWDKKEGKDAIQLSKHDEKSDSYCLITLYKSTPGTADSKENFDMAWTSLVKETIPVSTTPEMQPAATENGWEIQSGHAPYESEGTRGVALLVTASAAEKMVNMIILTNTDVYEKEMTALIESISLKKIETLPVGQPENPQQSTNTSKETFDLITYSPPKGWIKNVEETFVSYTITDSKKNTWCRINVMKSTISKGTIEADFENEWQELIVNNYKPTDKPKESDIQKAEGFKIKVGTSKFTFDNSECSAMLSTATGYNRCVSIVAAANNRDHINEIQAFIESIELIKPEATAAEAPAAEVPAAEDVEKSIIGTWVRSASNQSDYSVNNGISGNTKSQYSFNRNGTYTFYRKSFQMTYNKLLLARESGSYKLSVKDNITQITINPQKSIIEEWSKENGTNQWGKLLSTQGCKLEIVTYGFFKHYAAGVQKWYLILDGVNPTQRDGPYNGGSLFNNAWMYGPGDYPIELPN